jgi:hypothetical protein
MTIEFFPFNIDNVALGCAHEPEDVVERAFNHLRNYASNVVERGEIETFIGRVIVRRLEIERDASLASATRH